MHLWVGELSKVVLRLCTAAGGVIPDDVMKALESADDLTEAQVSSVGL